MHFNIILYNYKLVFSSMVQPSVTGLKQKTYCDFVNVYEKTKLPYGLQAAQYHNLKCIL
jgi:hypothetical protein